MPTHENASETEQAPTQVAARSLLLQLILLLSLLYLAVLCKVDLVLGLSLACTAACAIIAWQRPSKTRSSYQTNSSVKAPVQSQPDVAKKSQYPQTHNLSGIWIKDKHASDSMEELLHVMQVNRLIRAAVGLVKGVELRQTGDSFKIAVLSGILWFKIIEEYPFSGEMQRYKRRDLRKGMHRGTIQKLDDGAVCVTLEWDAPLGGLGTDVFYTVREGLLYVDSTMLMNGKVVKYRTIYNKLKK